MARAPWDHARFYDERPAWAGSVTLSSPADMRALIDLHLAAHRPGDTSLAGPVWVLVAPQRPTAFVSGWWSHVEYVIAEAVAAVERERA